ncbi:hypothetical protein [Leucobacter salsicius]|uniref:hypothetical protein n=1 Tax=Leucobacter salsicius TaxID=664638 RepID=UPI00034C534D|nr:hypothetical protein [Leucobacter salsicius]
MSKFTYPAPVDPTTGFDSEDYRDFCDAIDQEGHEGFVALVAPSGKGAGWGNVAWLPADDVEAQVAWIDAHDHPGTWGIYRTMNSLDGRGVEVANVTSVDSIVFDADVAEGVHANSGEMLSYEQALSALESSGFAPTATTFTGGGLLLVVQLRDALHPDSQELGLLEERAAYWAMHVFGPSADVAVTRKHCGWRRVCGSVNRKNPEVPQRGQLLDVGPTYDYGELVDSAWALPAEVVAELDARLRPRGDQVTEPRELPGGIDHGIGTKFAFAASPADLVQHVMDARVTGKWVKFRRPDGSYTDGKPSTMLDNSGFRQVLRVNLQGEPVSQIAHRPIHDAPVLVMHGTAQQERWRAAGLPVEPKQGAQYNSWDLLVSVSCGGDAKLAARILGRHSIGVDGVTVFDLPAIFAALRAYDPKQLAEVYPPRKPRPQQIFQPSAPAFGGNVFGGPAFR